MVTKPFLAARIPEDLNTKLEEHSASTGEGRTQAVINALAKYLNFTPESKSEESAGDRLSVLEKKVAELEKIINEPKQISMALDLNPAIAKEHIPLKITTDNKADEAKINIIDPIAVFTDNDIDNTTLVKANQEESTNEIPQNRGREEQILATSEVCKLTGFTRKKLEYSRDENKLPIEKNGWRVLSFEGKRNNQGRISSFWKIVKIEN